MHAGVECALDVRSLVLAAVSACACMYECMLEGGARSCIVSKKEVRSRQQAIDMVTRVFGELSEFVE